MVHDHLPGKGEDQLIAGVHQSGINASLGAGVPHSRGVSRLDAGVLQSPVNSLGDGGPQDAGSSGVSSQGGSILFDPKSLTADDEFSFKTHEEIKRYL